MRQQINRLHADGNTDAQPVLSSIVNDFLSDSASVADRSEMLCVIFDNIVDGIVAIDQTGTILAFNKAVEDMFGYDREFLYGKNVAVLMPEAHGTKHNEYIQKYLQTGQARIIGIGRELEGRRADGSAFPMSLAICEASIGERRIFAGVIRDNSEIELTRQSLQKAKNKAEEASSAKSRFLANMSHDLRTPLNAIIGFSQFLETQRIGALNDQQKNYLGIVNSSAHHLLSLINQILDLAAVEADKITFTTENVAPLLVVRECISLVEWDAKARDISIEVPDEAADGALEVQGDKTRIKQVVLNLLSNAIKYNQDGGCVKVAVEPCDDTMVRILVSDTGRGIPQDRQGELFIPFSRIVSADRPIEGTGIGLAYSKLVVERMGGCMAMSSREGEGSCFWLDLPQARSSSDENKGSRR